MFVSVISSGLGNSKNYFFFKSEHVLCRGNTKNVSGGTNFANICYREHARIWGNFYFSDSSHHTLLGDPNIKGCKGLSLFFSLTKSLLGKSQHTVK